MVKKTAKSKQTGSASLPSAKVVLGERIPAIGDYVPPPSLIDLGLEFLEAYRDVSLSEIPRENYRNIHSELSDLLMAYHVSTSMFDDDRVCDAASYGAIVHYDRLSKAIYDYPEARWDVFVIVERHDQYLSPGLALRAKWVTREAVRQQVKHCPVD